MVDPVKVDASWQGGSAFSCNASGWAFVVDATRSAGPTPMDAVAIGLATCVATDIVTALQRGRHPLLGLRISLEAQRAQQAPKRFTGIDIAVSVVGEVPAGAVERAIDMARERYCSVWHSLRPDLPLKISYIIALDSMRLPL